MNIETIPQGAINLIEDLLNPKTYGKINYLGRYVFPLCRAARARRLTEDYDIIFPIEIPEEYKERYEKSIQNLKDYDDYGGTLRTED